MNKEIKMTYTQLN